MESWENTALIERVMPMDGVWMGTEQGAGIVLDSPELPFAFGLAAVHLASGEWLMEIRTQCVHHDHDPSVVWTKTAPPPEGAEDAPALVGLAALVMAALSDAADYAIQSEMGISGAAEYAVAPDDEIASMLATYGPSLERSLRALVEIGTNGADPVEAGFDGAAQTYGDGTPPQVSGAFDGQPPELPPGPSLN